MLENIQSENNVERSVGQRWLLCRSDHKTDARRAMKRVKRIDVQSDHVAARSGERYEPIETGSWTASD